MPDTPQTDRFKPEMPQIPGVAPGATARSQGVNPAVLLVAGLLGVLVICFIGGRLLLRPKQNPAPATVPAAQIEVPPPVPDATAAMPRATEQHPTIATLGEMAKPWSAKDFFFVNALTGESVRALLVRLPSGSASQASGYWAFALKAPYGSCPVEYVTDMERLKNDYDFTAVRHPMVGNPCTRTIFDPLKMMTVTGDIWVRGGIVQGSDLRPPLGIEVKIQGKEILAVRME